MTNGSETTLSFPKLLATGLRLTFSTPGSYLKIPEIFVPEAGGIAHIEPLLPTQPNADGWYTAAPGPISLSHDGNTDVEVQYRIDGGAWQTGTTFDITADGDHRVDYRALWNGAEVPEVAGSLPVRIDTAAPTTEARVAKPSTLLRMMQPAAVFQALAPAEATVVFTATDATSGVALTEYSLDGTTWTAGSSVALTGAGDHVVRFRSTDVAGNVEQAQSATVTVVAGTAPGDGDGPGTGSGTLLPALPPERSADRGARAAAPPAVSPSPARRRPWFSASWPWSSRVSAPRCSGHAAAAPDRVRAFPRRAPRECPKHPDEISERPGVLDTQRADDASPTAQRRQRAPRRPPTVRGTPPPTAHRAPGTGHQAPHTGHRPPT